MKTIEIKGSLRTGTGKKSAKQVRRSEGVPCVIYNDGGNILFQAHENTFRKLVYTHEAHLVNIVLEDKAYKAVLKDMQFHPVSDKILHADFMHVYDDKPVTIDIPVTITGDSAGVKAGGKLIVKRRHLKAKGLAKFLPEELLVDTTELKIHQSVKVGDLKYDNVELLDSKITTVVTVATSRVAQKTEEGEGEATAEGAVEPVAEK